MMNDRTNMLLSVLVGTTLAVTTGCAEDLRADDAPSSSTWGISNTDNGDGTTTTHVDASDEEAWVYLHLGTASEVVPEDAENSQSWDLGFQRFKVKSNGGISGVGEMEVARLSAVDFDTLTVAPSQGYLVDADDSSDEDIDPDFAFLGPTPWYDYDPVEHTLSPADVVYVLRSVDGEYFKVQMLGYYDDAGTGGYPKFRWAPIEEPTGEPEPESDQLLVDASVEGEWTYVDVIAGALVDVDDSVPSTWWDVAFSRTQVRTNSGTSGPGVAGAMVAPSDTWEDVTTSPTVGFVVDEMVPVVGPSGSGEVSGNPVLNGWYDDASDTDEVSPKDLTFIVRTADGDYAKLRVLSVEDGVLALGTEPLPRAVEVHTDVLDAGDADTYVYFRFDVGAIVEPEDPATSTEWDLAIAGTKIQTNSGTSGPGDGAALDPAVAALADVTNVAEGSGCYLQHQGHVCVCEMSEPECAEEPGVWTPQCNCPTLFVTDELLPLPGPPGSGEYSGNGVLAAWYDYDPDSHATTPKAAAYVVRSAAGDFVKLQITDYVDGAITLDWAFAGPGETSF